MMPRPMKMRLKKQMDKMKKDIEFFATEKEGDCGTMPEDMDMVMKGNPEYYGCIGAEVLYILN